MMLNDLEIKRAKMEARMELLGLNDYRTIAASEEFNKLVVECQVTMKTLNKLNLGNLTLSDEVCKFTEEQQEFKIAVRNNDRSNMIEEFFDVIQAMTGVMQKVGISDEELKEGLTRHNKKLLKRGWSFSDSCRWC